MRVQAARDDLGWTQRAAAQKAGVTEQQLSRVETGANCTLANLLRVCGALGLRVQLEQSTEGGPRGRLG
ncbi:MAG: helix-turn-helix transcriptional regulator [Candidatus Latescibacterota bacterium]